MGQTFLPRSPEQLAQSRKAGCAQKKKKKKKRKVFRGERSDLEGGLPAWAQWPDVFLPRRGVFFGPPHPAALIRTLNTSHWRLYFGLLLELRVRVSCSKAHPIFIFSDFSPFSRKKKKREGKKRKIFALLSSILAMYSS